MSHAFVREDDAMLLQDVAPSLAALKIYLSNENNGIRVYEKQRTTDPANNREVYVMSNGFSYARDENSKWYII